MTTVPLEPLVPFDHYRACADKAREIFDILETNESICRLFEPSPIKYKYHCFILWLKLPKNSSQLSAVSISVPPDAWGNRGDRYKEYNPSTIETALITGTKTRYNLYYADELGYCDVRRFDGINTLIDELIRIAQINRDADADGEADSEADSEAEDAN